VSKILQKSSRPHGKLKYTNVYGEWWSQGEIDKLNGALIISISSLEHISMKLLKFIFGVQTLG
jgi:hypothetical protein